MDPSATRRVLCPEDLAAQVVPGQVALRGDRVVYTVRQVDARGERTDLWTVPYDGGPATRLTESPGHDHTPRISPDGTQLAFLREHRDDPTVLVVLELAGEQPRPLIQGGRGVHDAAWSPDGDWLAVLLEDEHSPRVHDAEPSSQGDRPTTQPTAQPTALVLTGADWRADGESEAGLRLYPRHLHQLRLDDGTLSRLTDGPWSASRPRVAPDGAVYFLADRRRDSDLEPVPQVCRVAPPGTTRAGEVTGVTEVTDMAGGVTRFHLAGTGVRALAHAAPNPLDHQPPQLYDVAPGRAPVALPGHEEQWLGRLGDETDLHEWRLELDDSAGLSVHSADGSSTPVAVGTGLRLVEGPVVCGALAEDDARRVAVLALGTGLQTPDLYALEEAGPRRLTEHGSWLDSFAHPRWERRVVPGPAGDITVHLLHPPAPEDTGSTGSTGSAEPRPTVLAIHGGPTGQWGVVPTLEAALLAGAGYLVAMPNIRGSLDRGPGWVRGLAGAWGLVDEQDALAVCDHLVEAGITDPDRTGVCGLSYGGFLTQWLVGRTDRFAAAVAENGVANQVAAWSGSAAGPSYCRSAGLGDAVTPEGVARLWQCSPLRNVGEVRTPLLLLQAGDDRTCPASDNEQLFVALRMLRREVEYVIYPEESHLMQATGRIDRRIDRHRRTVAWFDRFLVR